MTEHDRAQIALSCRDKMTARVPASGCSQELQFFAAAAGIPIDPGSESINRFLSRNRRISLRCLAPMRSRERGSRLQETWEDQLIRNKPFRRAVLSQRDVHNISGLMDASDRLEDLKLSN